MQFASLPMEDPTGSEATWYIEYLTRGEDDEICLFGVVGRAQAQQDRRHINLSEERFRKICLEEGINFKEAWPLILDHPDENF